MKILERRVYRGPDLYATSRSSASRSISARSRTWPSAKIPGFVERLLAASPASPSTPAPTATRRLRPAPAEDGGTWLGHVLEHVAIELQNLAAPKVTFGKTRGAGARGQYHVVFEYEEEPGRRGRRASSR
jgi:cyanophycin synthetase